MLRLLTIFLSIALLGNAGAAVSGLYTYTVNPDNLSVTITDYPETATGAIEIPATIDGRSVTSIGGSAFLWCSSLTSVTIPDSVTSIGNAAFDGCFSLTSINIPDSVTSIGSSAFRNCSSLTSITIPDSVTSIGNSAFLGTNLTYSSVDGVEYLFSDSYAFLIDGSSAGGDLSLPSDVGGKPIRVIADRAFYNCTSLTSVTIPNSVTSIGDYAFWNCTGLTSITIPNSVTSIGDYAFYNCSSLTSATIGNSVTSIGNFAFGYCTSLTSVTIGNSVTSIGGYAFYDCTSLTSIIIPDSVISIGDEAFRNCTGLISATIGNSVTSIGSGTFWGCSSLTSVTIGNSVTSIGGYAFYLCTSLTNIIIPDSVTSIGTRAFESCSSLTSATIGSSVTSIGDLAFYNCTGLTSIIIPNSVTTIGSSAFSGCTGLTSATIGNSVTSIGNSAFQSCSSLVAITFEGAPPAFNIDTLTDTSSEPILYYKSYPEAYNVYKETYNLPLVYLGPPNIQVQPQGAIASLAETINLSVAATDVQGSTLTYQWMRNGVDLIEKTAASLSITSLTATDTGSYQVKVSNSEGTTTSEAAAVTIVASQLYSQEQFDSALSSGFNLGVQSVSNNAQAYGLYTSAELIDLRPGSSQLQIDNNGAVTLQLQIQRSDDLSTWTSSSDDLVEVELSMQQGKGFFRFAMPQE